MKNNIVILVVLTASATIFIASTIMVLAHWAKVKNELKASKLLKADATSEPDSPPPGQIRETPKPPTLDPETVHVENEPSKAKHSSYLDYLEATGSDIIELCEESPRFKWISVPVNRTKIKKEELEEILNNKLTDSNFNVKRFCEIMCMERTTLIRWCKRYYGFTPSDLIDRRRSEKAAALLETTNFDLTEIASMCGFRSPSHLRQTFQKIYNRTPEHYMKI